MCELVPLLLYLTCMKYGVRGIISKGGTKIDLSQSSWKCTIFACRGNVHLCTAPCDRAICAIGAIGATFLTRGCTGGVQKVNTIATYRSTNGVIEICRQIGFRFCLNQHFVQFLRGGYDVIG